MSDSRPQAAERSYSSLPTPHPPGEFPATPAPGDYKQDEGLLEAAGRDAPTNHRAVVTGVLGAAVGLVVGGPVGLLAGATLGTAAGLEEQGLQQKLDHAGGQQKDAVPDLSNSPAQRMLGEGGSEPLSALLSGGAGAHLADREVEEPTTDKPSAAELSGLPVQDETSLDMTPAGQQTPLEEKRGLSDNQKLGLGAGAAGLGAGALAGTALSRNNDVHDTPVSKFDSPYTPGLEANQGPLAYSSTPATNSQPILGAPILPPQQQHVPSSATDNLTHNPEYTPTAEAGLAPSSTANPGVVPEQEDSRLKQAAPYAAAGAGLAGVGTAATLSRDRDDEDDRVKNETREVVPERQHEESRFDQAAPYATGATGVAGGAGAAHLLSRDEDDVSHQQTREVVPEHQEEDQSHIKAATPYAAGSAGLAGGAGAATLLNRNDDEDDASRLQSQIHEGPTSRSPEVVNSTAPAKSSPLAGAATLPHDDQSQTSSLHREARPAELNDEDAEKQHHGRETAAAAALGAIGGATGVEALNKVGASKEEAEMPKGGPDPTAALAAQLAGKDPATASSSRFHEGLDSSPSPTSAIPPRLQSRFSDATVETLSSDRTIDGAAPLDLEDQRAVAPVPLFREGSYLEDQDDKDSPRHNHKIAPEALAATTAVAAVPGFAKADPNSSVFQDFAHLSQPPVAAPVAEADPRELAQAQQQQAEEEKRGISPGMAGVGAGAAGLAGGGLAAAYIAEHRDGDSSAAALPHSPKHLNLRDQLGANDYSPSTPSSTRAMKGSPTASGAATPAMYAEQGAYTPPMRDQQEGFIATPYAAQSDYYAGNRDHQQTFSPQQQQAYPQEQAYPQQQQQGYGSEHGHHSEHGSDATSRMFHQQHHVGEVKEVDRSPHMGIATVQDTDGRHKLHKAHDADKTYDPEQGMSIAQQRHLEALNPVEKSPHMKIATRKDSIGHKKLHKKSLGDPLAEHQQQHQQFQQQHSQGSSPVIGGYEGSGSPARRSSIGSGSNSPRGSQGEGIWNGAVANVVNDETANRGGQRPGLVTIDSEDRRDHVTDRSAGINDSATRSAVPASPSQHGAESPTSNKLRRKSVSTGGNPNPRYGPDGFPRRDEDGNEVVKQGFVSKLFGHKKSASKSGTSPRTSTEGRRTSIDEQGRSSIDGQGRSSVDGGVRQ